MDWIDVTKQLPTPFQEVIVCSDENKVKAAVYLDNNKWSTFLHVTHWQPYPDPPERIIEKPTEEAPVETAKKKRGRPKKNGE